MSLLNERTILVSGVGLPGGFGTETVGEIRRQGGTPVITCYPDDRIARMARRCDSEALIFPCDFSREENIASLSDQLREQGIRLDGFLHSVANTPPSAREEGRTFLSMTTEEIHESIDVNALSFQWLARHLSGNFDPKKNILNTGAVGIAMTFELGSRRYIEPYWPMALAKSLLLPIALQLAHEMGPDVRFHLVNAGPVPTFSAKGIKLFERLAEIIASIIPAKRKITAQDIARGICVLLSPYSEMFDTMLTIDGGLSREGVLPLQDPRIQ